MPVCLITGASSGIGFACANLLAKSGARVYGASRHLPESTAFIPVVMDVTNDTSVRQGVGSILQREETIDILVNSAGVALAGAVEDTSDAEAQEQFEVNFFGVLRVCRAVLPAMRRQRSGYVVNMSSIGGLVAIPYQGFYSASKFALEGLSEAMRMELRPFGVHVVMIEPGDHRTALTKNRKHASEAMRNPAYREPFDRAVNRMARDEQAGPPAEAVARLVQRVTCNPHPRLRYTTGPLPERAAVWLKRLAPYALVQRVIEAHYSR